MEVLNSRRKYLRSSGREYKPIVRIGPEMNTGQLVVATSKGSRYSKSNGWLTTYNITAVTLLLIPGLKTSAITVSND
jgi:hypothetical protein